MNTDEPLDLTGDPAESQELRTPIERPWNEDQERESTRGDLARGLLWLVAFTIGGVLLFIGTSRINGSVLTESVFPSLIALAGTALGFYFGSQAVKNGGDSGKRG